MLKAQCIKNGRSVAIKCMKNTFDSLDQARSVSICSNASQWLTHAHACALAHAQVNNLREIQALHRLSPHPNVIRLLEVLYDQSTGRLALVFELMDMNVYELIRGRRHYVPEDRVARYVRVTRTRNAGLRRAGVRRRSIMRMCDVIGPLAGSLLAPRRTLCYN